MQSLQARIAAAREQVKVAERQVALQQTELDNMVIRAPFSGVAISKDAQPGEMVSPVSAGGGFTRTGICTIVDMKSLEIEVDVNESYINRVTAGQPVTAVLDAYPDWQIPARVITTVPTADRQKATVLVRIGFDRARSAHPARHGRQGHVPARGRRGSRRRGCEAGGAGAESGRPHDRRHDTRVRRARQDAVERRAIQTGGTDGDRLEVVAGLSAGDRVVVSPPESLGDGVRIAVKSGS